MLIDLILDLVCRIGHVDRRVGITGAHLRLRALQGGEELRVNEQRLGVLELGGNITGETEIGILVDCAGDKAGDVGFGTEDLREGVGEGWGGLNCNEMRFADVVTGGMG